MSGPEDIGYWEERWAAGRIGWHLESVHPLLHRHAGTLESGPVLVPLAGKSRDLLWLRDTGHEVIAVEAAEAAVTTLHAEAGLTARRTPRGKFTAWESPGLTVLQGDVFDLAPDLHPPAGSLYDRAALFALPPGLRPRYVAHLRKQLAPGATGLIITLDYDQRLMPGPPFAVSPDELTTLFSEGSALELLEEKAVPTDEGPFARHDVREVVERAHRVRF